MKLSDVLLLGVAVLFLIIGIDQTIVLGFYKGYWAFMLALAAFFFFTYRKSRRVTTGEKSPPPTSKKRKGK